MFRAWTACVIGLCAAAFVADTAAAQRSFFPPNFDPPLDAPAPLIAPVEMALTPGARATCASREWISGADAPRPAQARVVIEVSAAENGVRLRVAEPQFGLFDYTAVKTADGAIALEQAVRLGEEAPEAEALAAALAKLAPELRLHGRTLSEGDALFDNREIAALFAETAASIDGGVSTPLVRGGVTLAGETVADGRRVLVFATDLTLAAPPQGLTIGLVGHEAFDIDTGLRLYADATIEIRTDVEGRPSSGFVIRQEVVCALGDDPA